MKTTILSGALVVAGLVPAMAHAQSVDPTLNTPPSVLNPQGATVTPMPSYDTVERPSSRHGLDAPSNAFEISVGTGYTQGFGNLQSGVGMPSVASAGVGFDLGVGYRIDPSFAVMLQGQYQELTAERTSAARGLTTGLAGQYHVAPTGRLDPWIEVGAGYRFLWEDPSVGPTLLSHGFQLARARVGLDVRVDEAVALGPVVGADANLFMFQDAGGISTTVDTPKLSTFVFGGVQGRFDVGGSTGSSSSRSMAKR